MSEACNCIVCAKEFNTSDVLSKVASKINKTRFKICDACINNCDPSENYLTVQNIIKSCAFGSDAIKAFGQIQKILKNF